MLTGVIWTASELINKFLDLNVQTKRLGNGDLDGIPGQFYGPIMYIFPVSLIYSYHLSFVITTMPFMS